MPALAERKTLIERIREKPEPTRWAILIAITMVVGGLLMVFWVKNLSNQLASLSSSVVKEPGAVSQTKTSVPSSFRAAIRGVASSFKAIRSGEDPRVVAEKLQETVAAAAKPPLPAPSVLRAIFSDVSEVVRFNLAMIGGTLKDLPNILRGKF